MSGDSKGNSVNLTRVVLYKHGIGYFERRGQITGPQTVELVCAAAEIDDMLKSLVALTTSGTRVDAITYDSAKSLTDRLGEFGFDLTETAGLLGLLVQMKGIPVTVTVSGEKVSGRVLGVDDSEQIVADRIVREHLLTLYTGATSFRRVALSSVNSITVDDDSMASEMNQQLELLFQNVKKKDRKSLRVNISKEGEDGLFIAYSIPCPIWKTSYRLVLEEESGSPILLQGMAIVDNVQEEDWNDVEIVLVSSSPISFIQPLYDPVQPYRPTIAPQGITSSGPQTAERSQRLRSVALQEMDGAACYDEGYAMPASPAAAPAPALKLMQADFASAPLNVEASGSANHFEYRITNRVSVPRNSSALLPIVQQTVEGERISLFNEEKNARFPHSAVRMKNTTSLTLEGGPVTIMEADSYAGEALLDTVKPLDTRYLLFAVDLGCPVVVRITQDSEPYWRVRSVGGNLFLDFKAKRSKVYQIDNLDDKAKQVILEHPITQDWRLKAEKPFETSESYYRFKVEVGPHESKDFVVEEETESYTRVAFGVERMDMATLNGLIQQNFVDRSCLEHLVTIVERQAHIRFLREQIEMHRQSMTACVKDQQRALENLKTLGANNERYRRAVDDAEDKIQNSQAQIQELTTELKTKEQELQKLLVKEFISELKQLAK